MTKNKIIIIFAIALTLLSICSYSNAQAAVTHFKSINDTARIELNDICINSINFIRVSNSIQNFGVTGTIKNNGYVNQNISINAAFYDENYNIISALNQKQEISPFEEIVYNQIGDKSDISDNYTVDDICYYKVSIVTEDTIPYSNNYINYDNYDYTINSYNIDMTVNENNTFDITETIEVYFLEAKHGIYRKIPLKNTVTRTDGTSSTNRAQISNIYVSHNFTTYNENGYKVIKIGDANKTLTGRCTYTIKYTYNLGKDPLKNADELYFNLIGDEWDTCISNATFSINMPKKFDKSLIGFSSGIKGATSNSNVKYTVTGNIINGKLDTRLEPGQALTVRITLPEGYFVGASWKKDEFSILVMIIALMFVLISCIIWKKFGKDDEVIETIEFYPPEGYNSAEVGFIYNGTATKESIISLIVYLANKGYLKIEDSNEGNFFEKDGFKIIKIKDYDGDNQTEKMFFNGLFKGKTSKTVNIEKAKQIVEEAKKYGETISFREALELSGEKSDERECVTRADLYNKFYKVLNKIELKMESKSNVNKIYERTSQGKGKWLILMAIAIYILITIKPVTEGGMEMLPIAFIFPIIGFSVLLGMVFGKTPISTKIFGLVWGGMFGGMPWALTVLPGLVVEPMYLITYIVGVICIATLILFIKIMKKRTPYGNEMLGKIKGFRRFLETAEKEQLESLVIQNPEYFYNILPYTYALGVSDVWISQFETIALKAPDWYTSKNRFDMHTFGRFMTTTMKSASNAMSSSPARSGGSSGGGSSGGGSGGGGGGSW